MDNDQRLSWPMRCLSLLVAIFLLGLLITARYLEPDAAGFGTHQQLGLPACTSIVLFGANCPACGMTTSWAWVTRGEMFRAIQINAGGSLLALIAIAYLPTSCYFFFGGRRSRHGRCSLVFGVGLLSALAIATLQWASRLFG